MPRYNPSPWTPYPGNGGPHRTPPAGAILNPKAQGVSIQARSSRQNSPLATRYRCATCQIEYEVINGEKARCPLCDMEKRLHETQQALHAEIGKNELLTVRLQRSMADASTVEAMRQGIDMLDPRDLAFLKAALYRWRAEPDRVRLSVVHAERSIKPEGRKRARKEVMASGFLLMEKGCDPETHECSSIGGVVIAEQFELTARQDGIPKALDALLRTLVTQLSGRTE